MVLPARIVADWFLARAALDGEQLTQMKLQKLAYIAHGWNLALYSEPLIEENIEAWRWGPVVRSLYREFAQFGSGPISVRSFYTPTLDSRTIHLLEQIWTLYGKYTAVQLSEFTHAHNTPWKEAYNPNSVAVIPNISIEHHYKNLLEQRAQTQH